MRADEKKNFAPLCLSPFAAIPMKLSDYVMRFIADQGVKHVFMLPGGGAMHLNDSLGQCKDLEFVPVGARRRVQRGDDRTPVAVGDRMTGLLLKRIPP